MISTPSSRYETYLRAYMARAIAATSDDVSGLVSVSESSIGIGLHDAYAASLGIADAARGDDPDTPDAFSQRDLAYAADELRDETSA